MLFMNQLFNVTVERLQCTALIVQQTPEPEIRITYCLSM